VKDIAISDKIVSVFTFPYQLTKIKG